MDDFDFDFQEDTGNDYESYFRGAGKRQRVEEAERFRVLLKNFGVDVKAEGFTDPLAIEIMNLEIPPKLSLLYEYDDHEDNYKDLTTKLFADWYRKEGNAEITQLFVACALEKQRDTRPNYKGGFYLDNYVKSFNTSGMKLADSGSPKRQIIQVSKGVCARAGRIYNVWYRNNYPGDGGDIFATKKLGGKTAVCHECGSYRQDGYHVPSDHYLLLRECWHAHNSLTPEQQLKQNRDDT